MHASTIVLYSNAGSTNSRIMSVFLRGELHTPKLYSTILTCFCTRIEAYCISSSVFFVVLIILCSTILLLLSCFINDTYLKYVPE